MEAQASGLSRMTICRIWRAFRFEPHRADTFKLSPDPQLVERVRDIVGLYAPDHALVFGVDERVRSRRSTAHSRCCLCGPGEWAPLTTNAMGQLRCLPRWN
jgi:hypothetical protein